MLSWGRQLLLAVPRTRDGFPGGGDVAPEPGRVAEPSAAAPMRSGAGALVGADGVHHAGEDEVRRGEAEDPRPSGASRHACHQDRVPLASDDEPLVDGASGWLASHTGRSDRMGGLLAKFPSGGGE